MAERRVLSIQSHVVCGYVGNKSATLPLQVLGFDVDAVNSVQLSNHTGYAHYPGQVLNAQQLDELIDGLRANNLLSRYSHLLTGYIGDASFLRRVAALVQELRTGNPHLIYVCDPVMGDNGRMYVPQQLLPLYRRLIVPLADVLTPNQFEAQLLAAPDLEDDEEVHHDPDCPHPSAAASVTITDVASACRVMDSLHARGVGTVVLSSTDLGSASHLVCLASQRVTRARSAASQSDGGGSGGVSQVYEGGSGGVSQTVGEGSGGVSQTDGEGSGSRGGVSQVDGEGSGGGVRRYRVDIPRLDATFTGSGDLFTACLLARMADNEGCLARALELTIASVHSVLCRTVQSGREVEAAAGTGGPPQPFHMELKLVQCLEQIKSPDVVIKAQQLHL